MPSVTSRLQLFRMIFILCGNWLVALGACFLYLRPSLLPEDPQYIGSLHEETRLAAPDLERWPHHVFNDRSCLIIATGTMTSIAPCNLHARRKLPAFTALLLTATVSEGLMSATHFFLHSHFRWLQVLVVLLWLASAMFCLSKRTIFAPQNGIGNQFS